MELCSKLLVKTIAMEEKALARLRVLAIYTPLRSLFHRQQEDLMKGRFTYDSSRTIGETARRPVCVWPSSP